MDEGQTDSGSEVKATCGDGGVCGADRSRSGPVRAGPGLRLTLVQTRQRRQVAHLAQEGHPQVGGRVVSRHLCGREESRPVDPPAEHVVVVTTRRRLSCRLSSAEAGLYTRVSSTSKTDGSSERLTGHSRRKD